jgi:hypothetical protein
MGDEHTHQSDAIILSKKSYLYFGQTIYNEVGSGKFD